MDIGRGGTYIVATSEWDFVNEKKKRKEKNSMRSTQNIFFPGYARDEKELLLCT